MAWSLMNGLFFASSARLKRTKGNQGWGRSVRAAPTQTADNPWREPVVFDSMAML